MGRRAGLGLTVAWVVLYLAHNDVWNWRTLSWVGPLPAGLAWHVGLCLAASAVFWLFTRPRRSSGSAREASAAGRERG